MGYIKDEIKKYFEQKPDKQYPEKMLSPSMAGGCPRVMYYQLNNIKQTTPPSINDQLNFEVGNLWELKIAEYLDKIGILIYWWNEGQSNKVCNPEFWSNEVLRQDKWVDEELNVAGTPDIVYYQDNKIVLLDSKTASKDSVSKTAKQTDEEYWHTHYGHKMQLGLYLILAKRRYDKGLEKIKVDYGKLVIINKDNGSIIKEPCLFYTQELEREILDRVDYLNRFIKNNEIPPCECNVESQSNFGLWKVSYCNYGDITSLKENSKKRIVSTRCCNI